MGHTNPRLDEFFKLPIEILKKHTKMLKWEGVCLIILGVSALLMPFAFAKGLELLFAVCFILGGLAGLVRSLKAKDVPGTIVSILFYLLFIVAGVLLLSRPYIGILTLAVILGFFFFISGFFKIIFSFNVKPVKNWIWSLIDGLLCIIIGVMIFSEWPVSGPFFVSILVGIRLLFLGNSMIMIGVGLENAAKDTAVEETNSEEVAEDDNNA